MIKAQNKNAAFYYLLKYVSDSDKNQKHLRLVWSRSFQQDGWFSFRSTSLVYFSHGQYRVKYLDTPESIVYPFLDNSVKSVHNQNIFRLQTMFLLIDYLSSRYSLSSYQFSQYLDLLTRYYQNTSSYFSLDDTWYLFFSLFFLYFIVYSAFISILAEVRWKLGGEAKTTFHRRTSIRDDILSFSPPFFSIFIYVWQFTLFCYYDVSL